ncbi:50S ribosomal protein L3 [bacterium]|nr:50S ribosomal protein L3 [bacterium]
MKGIFGTKLGMTQAFDGEGRRHALTVIEARPGTIIRVKSEEKDKYAAVQVGFFPVDARKVSRPVAGQVKKHLQLKTAFRLVREFRVTNPDDYKVGQEITVESFAAGDVVDVKGRSVGKGFQGAIRRHHHSRGPMTHGSKNRREAGSIGTSATPSRVLKGRPMAGHLGSKTTTVQRVKVFGIDADKNLLFIEGGVPGSSRAVVRVVETKKRRKSEQAEGQRG